MPLKPKPQGLQPLQRVRIHRRMTQGELADATGVWREMISYLETGVRRPTRLLLARLCRALDAKPEQLFTKDVLDELREEATAAKR